METQAEDKVSSQPPNLDKVLEKINEIARISVEGDYIYRGETKYHCKVSSTLYREYEKDIKTENFDITVVQERILEEAKEYTHKTNDFEILTELQHYGGKTNLIDFTTDYLVALFFACDGEPEEPGRVILLQRPPKVGPKPYKVKKPPGTIRRAEVQKSIFVQAPKGVVEPDKVVCIPADLKVALLRYLNKHHDISTKNIYNDLLGFIEKSGIHRRAYTEFHKGSISHYSADSAKTNEEKQKLCEDAIAHYTKAIDLKPDLSEAYIYRGLVYGDIDDFDTAIADYSKAINLAPENAVAYNNRGIAYSDKGDFYAAIADLNTAINLTDFAGFYCNRGQVWLHLKAWGQVKSDFTTAKDMGDNIIEYFHNFYKSVEDFEAKNGVKLPEDIAALLRRV